MAPKRDYQLSDRDGRGLDLEAGSASLQRSGLFDKENGEMTEVLDRAVRNETSAALGGVVARTDIRSSVGPFLTLPGYKIKYPGVVVRALARLYREYNQAFAPLVTANREWSTDYQYCHVGGGPINWAVQVDMVGLPDEFLESASGMSEETVVEVLRRGSIFELENSLAMYQLLERGFQNGTPSYFQPRFRATLKALRERFGRPIALLAVTDQKHVAMRESEFGRVNGELLSDAEVKDLSGFDRLMGPDEFRQHLAENGGECAYLLYARTSDPVAKLKNPGLVVEHPLLADREVRRIIKANALTFNVDDPAWPTHDARRINDTKRYMPTMGMAFEIGSEGDLLSREFGAHLAEGKPYADFPGRRFTHAFEAHLVSQGANPEQVESGTVELRYKPLSGTYGCYGHLVGSLSDRRIRQELRRSLRQRGNYVVQPELKTPVIRNTDEGRSYTFIDRIFLGGASGQPEFLGGFRDMLPMDSVEAQKGRIHGNGSAVWAEIVA